MNEREKQNFINYSVKALAVFGLVSVLFLGGIGIVKILGSTSGIFSNLGSVLVGITSQFIPAEKIIVSVIPEDLVSGDSLTLSFEHQSKIENGSYSFFYECLDGLHFEQNKEIIFCNTEYDLLNEKTALDLKVFSTKEEFLSVPTEIRFRRNNSDKLDVVGEININVSSTLSDSNSSGTNGTIARRAGERTEEVHLFNETTSGGLRPSDPLGTPDLKPKILEIGVVDKQTNEFTATSSVPFSARVAVKFEVENVGDRTSGGWTFNSVLPSFPLHIYYSNNQTPLAPGDRIEFILGFDSIKNDGTEAIFVVNVDPSNIIREANENNNIVKTTIDVFGSN